MKIQIKQTIINYLNDNRILTDSYTTENYIIIPDSNKIIRNKRTKQIYSGCVCLPSGERPEYYEEIDKN